MTSSLSHCGETECTAGHPVGAGMAFPCSAAQRRAWFVNALYPKTTALNIALRWELRGGFDPSIVEQAFQIITERHEILRTVFVEEDGAPVQRVVPSFKVHLPVLDLSVDEEAKRLKKASEFAQEEARRPFDIGALPLLRMTLLRLAADHAFLLVTAHQMIFDGTSIRLLFHELGTIAAALAEARPITREDLPLQYGDYCLWQKEYLASSSLEDEANYWKEKLAGASYFEIEPDFPHPARRTSRGEIVAMTLPPEIGEKLEPAARAHSTTVFALGCAVAAAMLHRYSGKPEILFGTQISGRDDEDLENLIGVFINNLVLRFAVSGDPTFDDFLSAVKITVEDALIHQRMPFDKLVEILNPPRDPKRTPLISVNFAVLNDDREPKTFGPFTLSRQPSHATGSLYDLNFSLLRWPDGWRLALEFNPDLFARNTAEAMLGFMVSAFRLAVSNPKARLSVLAPPIRGPATRNLPYETEAAAHALPAQASPAQSEAPSEAETKMMAIWQDILGLSNIGPQSNFFDLGGHSLTAMRLAAKVTEAFGTKINVAALFEAPTVRELTALLACGPGAVWPWNIVRIQSKGSRTPVIAINNTALYYNLSKELGEDRPFIGIQLFDPEAPRTLDPRSIEDITADYVRLIRQARPHGPYILLGLCHAAVIAYEAAQQLRQAGELVPLIIMADPWLPAYIARLPYLRRSFFLWSYRNHERLHRLGLGALGVLRGQQSLAKFLVSIGWVRKLNILTFLARLGVIAEPVYEEPDWENRWFLPHLHEARKLYEPRETKDCVVVLRSEDVITPFSDEGMGWSELAKGRFFLRRIKGWHQSIFQGEGLGAISGLLRPLLDEVDREGGC